MKQAIKSTKMITMGLFTLCAMGFTNATFAAPNTNDPIEFKFVGKVNNQPVFQLNLDNRVGEDFFISIKDENNSLLYSEKLKVKDAIFSRNYRLAIAPEDMNASGFGVKVEVTSAKTHKTEVYRITSHTTVNENIVVAQL
ncbi:MAG: hypothetical protein M3015_08275 [Bacteroidota bacterium]|nr:hypothetical protein [Bacteroidota bacterium]